MSEEEKETVEATEADPKDEKRKERQIRKEAKLAQRTTDQWRAALRRKVRMRYDLQRLAIQMEGRTGDRKGANIELHEADLALLSHRAKELRKAEKAAAKDVEEHLSTNDFYTRVLSGYKGLGPTMAGVIMSEFDIYRANTPSAMWAFAGLAPVPCERCKRCNTVVMRDKASGEYKHDGAPLIECPSVLEPYASARSARPVKGQKLNYNKFLKTKMVGVLADCLLKAGGPQGARTNEWSRLYDNYKHRMASSGRGRSDAHRHRAAVRYMVKMLLCDIWVKWREYEGLPVRNLYQEQYLGHRHAV